LMMLFLIIGRWTFKKRDTLTFLAAAMIITLFFNAPQLFTAGFLMSYGVLFGLLCLGPPLTRLFHKIRLDRVKLAAPLATSVGATVSVFPLSAYYFNNIALAAPIANLFAIPLAGIIIAFTGIGSLVALFSLPIGHALAFPAELGLQALTWLNGVLATSSFGLIEVYAFPIWMGIFVFAMLFLCSDYVLLRSKIKAIAVGAMAAVLLCCGIFSGVSQSSQLKAVILDVGTGDAIHIAVDNKDYLIDNGGNLQYSQISDYAKNNRLIFDSVIVTNDRTKNLKDLAAEGRISTLYVPTNYVPKEYDADLQMKYYALYDKIELSENAYLDVVADDQKHLSFVLHYKGRVICLFAQNDVQDIVYRDFVPVVKLAGGGDTLSADSGSLESWNPDYAVISVRQKDGKGLPDPVLTGLLAEMDVSTLITAQTGAVTIIADHAGAISVTTQKK
ncbi:MAG: ComEC/Rec2 family competence protein, partial [Christensenella sp.]|uniref:ComEC/Rec2 family competence protein n=1 Tax=Christensenella sp. TaxID=1935934 RepID=UPI002B1ED9F0